MSNICETPYDIEKIKYPIKLVNSLIKDKRLKNIDGFITAYDRCTYESSKEIKQYGYNMRYTINFDDFTSYTGGLSFWFEEGSDYIFIKHHIVEKPVVLINKNNIKKITNYIVSIIIKKSFENNLREMVI